MEEALSPVSARLARLFTLDWDAMPRERSRSTGPDALGAGLPRAPKIVPSKEQSQADFGHCGRLGSFLARLGGFMARLGAMLARLGAS